MEFTEYTKKQNQLQRYFQQANLLAKTLQLPKVSTKLDLAVQRMTNEKFTIVVIGQFSRGKSTFVNAMLGRSILPSSKKPTTNVINKIVYGSSARYILHFKDKKIQPITEKQFLTIKAQSEKEGKTLIPGAVKNALGKAKAIVQRKSQFEQIEFAEIQYPLEFCKNHVEVVDTPGTNDLNVGRVEITYNYLDKAEAAILILGADQPLSKSEKIFLKERVLGNQIKDVFIVINYKDQLNGPQEENRVKEYIINNLQDLGDFSTRVYLVSSLQALLYRRQQHGEGLKPKDILRIPADFEETGFPAFEQALAYFLENEKGMSKLKRYIRTLDYSLEDIESTINTRLENTKHSVDELRAKLQVEKPKYERTKRDAKRITDYLQSCLDTKGHELAQRADMATSKIKRAAVASIDNVQEGMDEDEIQHVIETATTPIIKSFIDDAKKFQEETITQELNVAAKHLQRIWSDMDFDIKLSPIKNNENKKAVFDLGGVNLSPKDNRISGALTAFLIAGLLGATGIGWAAAAVFGWFWGASTHEDPRIKLKRQIREQCDKKYAHFGESIKNNYQENVKRLCNDIQNDIDTRIDTMEDQLQLLIQSKEAKDQDTKTEQEMLNKQLQEIESIRSGLRKMMVV